MRASWPRMDVRVRCGTPIVFFGPLKGPNAMWADLLVNRRPVRVIQRAPADGHVAAASQPRPSPA